MSKILVTGGAGFIGAHVVAALLKAGHDVVVLDDFNEFLYSTALKRERLKHLAPGLPAEAIVEADIAKPKEVQKVFGSRSFDLVIHLAAYANPGKSMEHEALYYEMNVTGTQNILEAVATHKVPRLIFAGSSSAYDDRHTPFKEGEYPLRPRSPYGTSKAEAEALCEKYQRQHRFQLTILRFFSVYGPWGRPDMAPFVFAERILQDKPIQVTADERKRDFTYISDVVDGIMAAVETPFDREVINIGRGEPVSLQEFIQAIERVTGKTAQQELREAPPGEMRTTYADISKARELLGYEPKVHVEDGMRELVTWLREWYLPWKAEHTQT